ncbi:uncharacterized protein LOC132038141 [Lycium ferocissimum]|uniref:uncharacterized protein LOC132038141 n=1 Tax=Lycium ferocissimum TaxID=112874 RepID=UPI002815C967|nr:uncharacterized protein LOC132038141 [Lycium ferocissimum]
MGNLARLIALKRPLAMKVQTLANSLVQLDISDPSRVLSCVEVRSSLLDQIKAKQFEDAKLCKIRDKVLSGEAKEAMIDSEGVLRIKGLVCIPRVDDLIRTILEESHNFVAKCRNCQQVKYEHRRPGGVLQKIPIPEWKWERIPMDFVVGLLKTLEKLVEIYICELVCLHANLSYEEEPIAILDREVRKLRPKKIALVKAQWKHRSVEDATWETQSDMRSRYPQLFT